MERPPERDRLTTLEVGAQPAPPPPRSSVRIGSLRRSLDEAGFTAAGVRAALAAQGELLSAGAEAVGHDRRLETAPPLLAALIRLLVLERELPLDAVGARLLEPLVEHGLVEEADGALHGLVRLVPHDHLLVASDSLRTSTPDHVAAVHRPSATLANLTMRRGVDRAVDVGTGNGVQAILCASHCARVVATDVNERALAFAEFNAALNGVDNVELRSGSFFEPVDGERFDLVVCNPPYVISPESSLVYRDSGLPGDAVSAQLVAELPERLADDGFGTIMISWAAGDDVAARPRDWLAGRGCDAWLLHTAPDDPLEAALAWNREARGDPELLRERVDAWLDYYARLGIERIAYGALVVHRRGGDTWFRAEAMPPERPGPSSDQLERMFAADLEGVLDRPLALAATTVVERAARLEGGRWTLVSAGARVDGGIGFGVNLDRVGAALVDCLDGSEPLRGRLTALATALDVPEARLTAFAETLALHLVERGMAA